MTEHHQEAATDHFHENTHSIFISGKGKSRTSCKQRTISAIFKVARHVTARSYVAHNDCLDLIEHLLNLFLNILTFRKG